LAHNHLVDHHRAMGAPEPASELVRESPPAALSAAVRWSLGQKIAFRFAAFWLVLVSLPFPIDVLVFQSRADTLEGYSKAWDPVVRVLGRLLGVPRPEALSTVDNGSADRPGNFLQLLAIAVIAALGTLIISLLDRRRAHYRAAYAALRVWVRYMLAATLFAYGFIKLWPSQMPLPSPARLIQAYGQSSPMGLLWAFMGASPAYVTFSGACEVLGGALLLVRRTTLLGALVVAGVMTNVVMLNLCYDVCVKLFSIELLIAALFLLLPSASRLLDFFVRGRAVPADDEPSSRWPKAQAVIKVAAIAVILYGQGWKSIRFYYQIGGGAFRPVVFGVYDVEAPAVTSRDSWTQAAVDRREVVLQSIAARRRFLMTADAPEPSWWLAEPESPTVRRMTLRRAPDGRVHIEGMLDGTPVALVLRPTSARNLLLLQRKFHWVNEAPFIQ
jgi:hypothetical protein